jgi:hypothetical protein
MVAIVVEVAYYTERIVAAIGPPPRESTTEPLAN